MKKAKQILIFGMIICAILLMPATMAYSYQTNTYNSPSYNNQYNYRYNSFGNNYILPNNYRNSAAANYVGGYGNSGWNPFLFGTPSKCGTTKCKTVSYTSHMYIDNKLDYQYYTHPELFQPRRMTNNQRWIAFG